MRKLDRNWWTAIGLTVALLLLITFSLDAPSTLFLIFMLTVIVLGVSLFYWLFPSSVLFSIAFANYLAVYACLFIFFIEENFGQADLWAIHAGFVAPVLAFLGGAAWHRREISSVIRAEEHLGPRPNLSRIILWLLPVMAIGAVSFSLPWLAPDARQINLYLIIAMGLIALVVFLVSRDVSRFLLDTGLLFEDFFGRVGRLIAPVFVFFTFYSLIVIVFAAIFRLIDRYAPGAQFLVDDVPRDITLQESLYFSLITLSTVGYGDIVPLSNAVRVVAGIEIVSGVLLLLFGVSEIMAYTRDHRRGDS